MTLRAQAQLTGMKHLWDHRETRNLKKPEKVIDFQNVMELRKKFQISFKSYLTVSVFTKSKKLGIKPIKLYNPVKHAL